MGFTTATEFHQKRSEIIQITSGTQSKRIAHCSSNLIVLDGFRMGALIELSLQVRKSLTNSYRAALKRDQSLKCLASFELERRKSVILLQ